MAQPHPAASPVQAETNQLRILLLEATEDDAVVIEAELTRNLLVSFTCRRADSLETFFKEFAAFSPQVVLSEYSLPDLECVSALRAIREWDRDLPFIFVTGCLREEHAIETLKQGATDYVLKEKLSRLTPAVERAVKEAREIASRRQAEESLRQAETELRTMLNNLPALAFKGWMDGSASFYDERVEDLTGYPKAKFDRSELIWLDLIHPEDRPQAQEAFHRALAGDKSYVREYRIITRSGEVRWIQERSHINCTPDNRVNHISGIILDITEYRNTHEALSRLLAESERSRQEISSLLKGARAVLEQEGFAITARKIFDSCREVTGAVSGYVALLSAAGEENEVLFLEDGGLPCTVDPSLPMPIRGLRGEAYRQGLVLYENDFGHSPWQALMPAGHVALQNVMFGPLMIGGQAVGLIGLANKPEDFTPEDARITGAFSEIAAMALKNARLKQQQEQAESTLREQNHFLQTLLDAIPNPVFYKDAKGRYLGCNAAFEDFWGIPRKELLGKTCHELNSAEIGTSHHEMDQALLRQGGIQFYEHQVKSVNQEPKDVIFYKSTFGNRDGSVGGLVGVVLDISARKQAERALEKARTEKQAILDNIPDMAWLKDKEDCLIAVNQAYCRACGRTQEDILGKTEIDIWGGRRNTAILLDDQEVLAPGEHLKLEEAFMDNEAKDTWLETIITPIFNETGEVMGSTGVARDITERRWMWEELNRSHKEIEHLFNSIPSIIIRLSPQGTVLQCNQGATKTLGVPAEQMLGQKLQDLALSWDWETISRGLAQCRQTLDGVSLSDVRFQGDGKERLLGLTLSPIRGETEPLMGIILLGADITARRIMEGQLAQAQKLESIGQLAAGIAHEINTPIQYVGDNTRFLLEASQDLFQLLTLYEDLLTDVEQGRGDGKLCQKLRSVQQAIDLEFLMGDIPRAAAETLEGIARVAKIVRAMKEFSHPGSGRKTPIDINRTVENTITVARNEWKYVADMVTDLDPDLPLVPLLSDEFNQVLLNLIINAAHAIADVAEVKNGGRGTISIRTRQAEDEAEVCVSDTGTGIPEAIAARVFDPFFTTKEVGRGTGQGLAIAHTIVVERHGGRISFETEAGGGTTFIIRVPLAASA